MNYKGWLIGRIRRINDEKVLRVIYIFVKAISRVQ